MWNANTEEDLAGYKVHLTSLFYNYSVVNVGNVTEYDLSELNLYDGIYYYIAVTAYDTSDNESDFSSMVYFFADDDIPTYYDNCPDVVNPSQEDWDDDGLGDVCDNCPDISNPNQEDTYPPQGNSIGDACDCEGNFDCDQDVDGYDATVFLSNLGRSQYVWPCTSSDPCNGDFDCDGDVDGYDTTIFLKDSGRSTYSNPCPGCTGEAWCVYK